MAKNFINLKAIQSLTNWPLIVPILKPFIE
jgi:hypothetical protein